MTAKNNKQPIDRDTLELTEEEKQFEKDFEAGLYKPVPNMEARIAELQSIAKKSIKRKETTATSIKRDNDLLEKIKREAEKEHLPYQTYIKSVMYKHVMAA